MSHFSSIQSGDTVYIKGFEDQEFEFIGQSAERPIVTVKLPGNRTIKTRAFPSLLCRLRAPVESVTGAETWIVPAIQVAKKPFSRLVGFSMLAAVLLSGAAQAQDSDPYYLAFCESASKANVAGISAAPDSVLAKRISTGTDLTTEDYKSIWAVAKSSIFPICRGLW